MVTDHPSPDLSTGESGGIWLCQSAFLYKPSLEEPYQMKHARGGRQRGWWERTEGYGR